MSPRARLRLIAAILVAETVAIFLIFYCAHGMVPAPQAILGCLLFYMAVKIAIKLKRDVPIEDREPGRMAMLAVVGGFMVLLTIYAATIPTPPPGIWTALFGRRAPAP